MPDHLQRSAIVSVLIIELLGTPTSNDNTDHGSAQ